MGRHFFFWLGVLMYCHDTVAVRWILDNHFIWPCVMFIWFMFWAVSCAIREL
jgi:hypothetical protein